MASGAVGLSVQMLCKQTCGKCDNTIPQQTAAPQTGFLDPVPASTMSPDDDLDSIIRGERANWGGAK